jgi:outer membrane protein OmpA-like peptidoglycan-associated protein
VRAGAARIAAATKNNPDWKLAVDGHTDSFAGDAYDLDLAKRRAAAVKQALVDQAPGCVSKACVALRTSTRATESAV